MGIYIATYNSPCQKLRGNIINCVKEEKKKKKKLSAHKRGNVSLRKRLQQTSLDIFFKPKPKTFDPGIPNMLPEGDMPQGNESQQVNQGSSAGISTDMCGDEVTATRQF